MNQKNQDWRKFGEGGKNRWIKAKKDVKNKIKNVSQFIHKLKQ